MTFGMIKLLGLLIYLYLIWRNLREDYKEDELIEFGWLSILIMLVGGRITYGFWNWGVWNSDILKWWSFWNNPGFNIWGGIFFWNAAMVLYAKTKNWKVWSLGEDLWPMFSLLITWWMLDEWVKVKGVLFPLWVVAGWLLSDILFFWAKSKYRSFVWYKSGKKGFSFLAANIVWGILMSVLVLVTHQTWWLIGLGAVWSLISITGLVILSHT